MAKASYRLDKEQTFVNPYNFVTVDWDSTDRPGLEPAEEEIGRQAGEEPAVDNQASEKVFTGVLHCELTTKTPLCIPDIQTVEPTDVEKHNKYSFMRDSSGKYMIPGSTLRGTIRSVYETVTDSCMITSDPRETVTHRAAVTDGANTKPGLLIREEDGWKLYPAIRYVFIVDDDRYKPLKKAYKTISYEDLHKDYQYGQRVYFLADDSKVHKSKKNVNGQERFIPIRIPVDNMSKERFPSAPDQKEGYLLIGEVPPLSEDGRAQTSKHFESIFKIQDYTCPFLVESIWIDRLKTIHRMYNDSSVNKNAEENRSDAIYKGLVRSLAKREGEGFTPIWYRLDQNGEIISLSPAQIGRVAYRNSMGQIIGTKAPCRDRKCLCPACRLFGTANKKAKVGSRVRITDAVCITREPEKDEVVLRELSGPKVSYLPFYTTAEVVNEGNRRRLQSLDDSARFRGRKYYWHQTQGEPYREDPSLPNGRTKRNATMEILKGTTAFKFDVFFDRISRQQLEELKWTITLGSNDPNEKHCHKIGHGKPIGLGSVKIVINEEICRSFDPNRDDPWTITTTSAERITIDTKQGHINVKENRITELLTITDLSFMDGVKVHYPFITGGEAGEKGTEPYQWFAQYQDALIRNKNKKKDFAWRSISEARKRPFSAFRIDDCPQSENVPKTGVIYEASVDVDRIYDTNCLITVKGLNLRGCKIFYDAGKQPQVNSPIRVKYVRSYEKNGRINYVFEIV